jgi:hypothetical protein
MACEKSSASTSAPSRAAGMLTAPPPAAMSRSRVPGPTPPTPSASSAARMSVAVNALSYASTCSSHTFRVCSGVTIGPP